MSNTREYSADSRQKSSADAMEEPYHLVARERPIVRQRGKSDLAGDLRECGYGLARLSSPRWTTSVLPAHT